MEIRYKNIVLRDYREADIDDEVRWNTIETAWALWDAPWEMEEELHSFDEKNFREKCRKELENMGSESEHRWCFEIDAAEGVHIGAVNAYCIDDKYEWKKLEANEPVTKDMNITLGIEICESSYWSGGWGTHALTAFIRHWLDAGFHNIYTQTWSGNVRMAGLAKKLGFEEVEREKGTRLVRGGAYDDLTFRLDENKFGDFLAKSGG